MHKLGQTTNLSAEPQTFPKESLRVFEISLKRLKAPSVPLTITLQHLILFGQLILGRRNVKITYQKLS